MFGRVVLLIVACMVFVPPFLVIVTVNLAAVVSCMAETLVAFDSISTAAVRGIDVGVGVGVGWGRVGVQLV